MNVRLRLLVPIHLAALLFPAVSLSPAAAQVAASPAPAGSEARPLELPAPFLSRPVARETLPDLPVEQTIDGVGMRVQRADFQRHRLAIDMRLSHVAPELKLLLTGQPKSEAWLFAPDGSFIDKSTFNSFEGVDPRWPFVTVVKQVMLPTATPGADGIFQEQLVFKNVEIPRKFDQELPVNQSLFTSRGTKITIESIKARARENSEGGMVGELILVTRQAVAPQVPIDYATASLFGMEDIDGQWKHGFEKELPILGLPIPPGTVKALNLTYNVREVAPRLRDPRWQRRFQFDIKLPPTTRQPVEADKRQDTERTTASAENGQVSATLVGSVDKSQNSFAADVWLRDKSLPADPHRYWFAKSWEARAKGSDKVFVSLARPARAEEFRFMDDTRPHRNYWKANGELVERAERVERVGWSAPAGEMPALVDLELSLAAIRRCMHSLRFYDIPAPTGGATLDVGREFRSGEGAVATLTTVRHIPGVSDRQGAAPGQPATQQPGQLELTLKIVPVLPERNSTILLNTLAIDNNGYSIRVNKPEDISPDRQESLWKITMAELPPNSKFSMQFVFSEHAYTGATSSLILKDIPIKLPGQ